MDGWICGGWKPHALACASLCDCQRGFPPEATWMDVPILFSCFFSSLYRAYLLQSMWLRGWMDYNLQAHYYFVCQGIAQRMGHMPSTLQIYNYFSIHKHSPAFFFTHHVFFAARRVTLPAARRGRHTAYSEHGGKGDWQAMGIFAPHLSDYMQTISYFCKRNQ